MSGVAGVAVTDRMKYGVKPSAVKTENLLYNIKATNGADMDLQLGNEVIFEVPSMGNGYYCDLGNSYFRFGIQLTCNTEMLLTRKEACTYGLRFERGIESIFRRIQITDASGNLLENLEHYNELYALQELMSAPKLSREGLGFVNGEGLNNSFNNVYVKPANDGEAVSDANTFTEYTEAGHALGAAPTILGTFPPPVTVNKYKINGRNIIRDLGSIIASANPKQQSREKIATLPCAAGGTVTVPFTFQISSAIFGGFSEKYIPMSAINGVRITMTLENMIGSMMNMHALMAGRYSVKIKDPTYFMNMIRVDPTVDQQLISSAAGSDGSIRIHSQTWSTFSQSITADSTSFDYLIPIRVSSLKAIFFGFTRNYAAAAGNPNQYWGNNGAFESQNATVSAGAHAITYTAFSNTDNFENNMKSAWHLNNLSSYQFFIDGRPSPATPVIIPRLSNARLADGTSDVYPSEAITELARAWHVGHKGFDNVYLSLMTGVSTQDLFSRNCIFGHEFESFSSKSSVIESGYNCMNSNIQLRLTFTGGALYNMNLRMYCMYDNFTVIDPQTGIIRPEF